MANDKARKRLVEMMFEELLQERFSRLAKKYGRGKVIKIWAESVKNGGIKAFLREREWNSHVRIIDALDSLDDYCDSVESMIRAKVKGGKKENDSALRN